MADGRGFYERRVFPWLNDRFTSAPQIERLRTEALAPARGRVLEIGFGTGLNLAHYGAGVRELVAVEPSDGMLARAAPRIAAAPFPVRVITGLAERLPLDDASFDTVVSVLTLCTVAQPAQALAQLWRVLRPEGAFLLLEHGLADDAGVARWQHRLDGLQTRVACGCHLDRDMVRLVREQGFRFEQSRRFFVPGIPRTHGWMTLVLARKEARS